MKRLLFSFCLAASAAIAVTGCSSTNGIGIAPRDASASSAGGRVLRNPISSRGLVSDMPGMTIRSLCPVSADPNVASCLGQLSVLASSSQLSSGGPAGGLEPNDLATIYNYPAPSAQGPTNQVIGVVVAYDYPNSESDLAAYRAHFNLPPCTSQNGCYTKLTPAALAKSAGLVRRAPVSVSANPTTEYPGWDAEVVTDTEAVSATCPHCKIIVSEAASANLNDLGAAVTAAVNAGATVISASFGAAEDSTQSSLESLFEPKGVKLFAAAGDNGPQVLFPAAATNVIAVAGTTISATGTTVSETLWSGSGGGCSAYFSRPAWQNKCSGRSIADLAVVGDPNTGLAFYDSELGGWGVVGGTSLSTPIVASMWALSGDTSTLPGAQPLYGKAGAYLAVPRDGGFAGLGIPNGLGAF